jgi:hypothetical protein
MERLYKEIPSTSEIVCMGDTHIGSALCHTSGIKRAIDYVSKSPNCYWLHMGDWIEAIATDDPRFSSESTSEPIPLRQAKVAVEMFKPIADKCLFGGYGNHELKLHRFGDLTAYICENLNIPKGGYTTRLTLTADKKKMFTIYAWHGPARGMISSNAKDYEQRQANLKASLKLKMKYKNSDCAVMLMGHVHKLISVTPTYQLYLYDAGPRGLVQGYLSGKQTGEFIDPDLRWYGCTGAFLKLYKDGITGYAEIGGYDPVELGYLLLKIKDGQIEALDRIVI